MLERGSGRINSAKSKKLDNSSSSLCLTVRKLWFGNNYTKRL